jgi:hypothetical protein
MVTTKESSGEQGAPAIPPRSWGDWAELLFATTLGLAALASAWSSYQSALWAGIQTFRLADANILSRKVTQSALVMNQYRTVDALLFTEYTEALSRDDRKLADFLIRRFRPAMRKATEAWLATHPMQNPSAPPTPFTMKEYSMRAESDLLELREREERVFAEARAANATSDDYTQLTVFFGIVMFLSGISNAFAAHRLKIMVLVLADLVLAGSLVMLTRLPLAYGL